MKNILFYTIAVLFDKLPTPKRQSLFTYGYSIFDIWYRKSRDKLSLRITEPQSDVDNNNNNNVIWYTNDTHQYYGLICCLYMGSILPWREAVGKQSSILLINLGRTRTLNWWWGWWRRWWSKRAIHFHQYAADVRWITSTDCLALSDE